MRVNPFSVNTVQNNKRANSQPLAPSFKGGAAVVDEFITTFNKAKNNPYPTEFTRMRDLVVHNKHNQDLVKMAKDASKDTSKAGVFLKSFLKAAGLAS